MNPHAISILETCATGALANTLTFPEIVGRLAEIGVERYHADYCRQEITYYFSDGESHVIGTGHEPHPIGREFSAAAVGDAVGQSQRNEHTYRDFLRKTMAAGCVGYFVQITGRRAIYFGRNGDSHVEHFPTKPNAAATAAT